MIDLRTYSSGDCNPGSTLKRALWYAVSRFFFETRFPWPSALKARLLKGFGAKIGPDLLLKPSVKIKYPWFLEVGESCWIGEETWIDNVAEVTLGKHVVISQGAVLLTGNHNYKSRSFDLTAGPIEIKDFAWIGAHSRIGPGVTVGEGAMLTFGAVTTKSLEPNGIYSGNPAVRIRERVMNE